MLKTLSVILALFVCSMSVANASGSDFCEGWKEGYKLIKGENVIVPICPIPPITPIGSTEFKEGMKAGINAANSE